MKKIILLLFAILPAISWAGGRTNWAVPTQVDIERGGGFMVYGAFGNPAQCTYSDRFYVRITHPQYDKIYAAVLAAFTSKKHIRTYIHGCDAVTWYAVRENTFNILDPSSDLNIKE